MAVRVRLSSVLHSLRCIAKMSLSSQFVFLSVVISGNWPFPIPSLSPQIHFMRVPCILFIYLKKN